MIDRIHKFWCNTHNRFAIEKNKCEGPGILLPCNVIDLEEVGLEILCQCDLSGEQEVAPCEVCSYWE